MSLGIALGALGAAAGGALAGFVAAVLLLQAKRLRNRRLMARGEAGIRDCVLPLVFVPLCAVASCFAGGVLGIFLAPGRAIFIGALAPAGLLAASTIAFALTESFGD